MRGCPALYDHGQQHLKARLPVDRVRHVRRHDAVAQTIQSVVHGGDPPVMQDEPRMGGKCKYWILLYHFMPAM